MTNPNDQSRTLRNPTNNNVGSRPQIPILLVTSMSGAGKTTALKSLEDIGYDAVDNVPLSLLSSLVKSSIGALQPLAIGIDIRNREFDVQLLLQEIDDLINGEDCAW